MLRLSFDSTRPILIDHSVTEPDVYLDVNAFMDIAEHHLDRFAAALLRRGGTFCLSWVQFVEFSRINSATGCRVETLLERVWPNVAFLEVEAGHVMRMENRLLAGIPLAYATHLHSEYLKAFAETPRSGSTIHPLDPRGFIEFNRGLHDSYKEMLDEAERELIEIVGSARRRYESDPQVRTKILHPPTGAPIQRPTRYIYFEMLKYLVKNTTFRLDRNHLKDSWHMIVPVAYCRYVVLDRTWTAIAKEIQRRLREAGLLTHQAKVFKAGELEAFLQDLETTGPPSGMETES